MRRPIFLRKDTFKKSRLGRKRKKKQKWRRPRGRHNKIREKRRGYGKQPSIGYGRPTYGLKSKLIFSPEELDWIKENEIAIVGKVGKKRKIEIAKKAMEKKIKLLNLNTETFLKKIEREAKRRKEKKEKVARRKEEEKEKEEKKEPEKKEWKSEEEKIKEKKEKEKEKVLHKEAAKPHPEEVGVKRKGIGIKHEKQEMFRKALKK